MFLFYFHHWHKAVLNNFSHPPVAVAEWGNSSNRLCLWKHCRCFVLVIIYCSRRGQSNLRLDCRSLDGLHHISGCSTASSLEIRNLFWCRTEWLNSWWRFNLGVWVPTILLGKQVCFWSRHGGVLTWAHPLVWAWCTLSVGWIAIREDDGSVLLQQRFSFT